MIRVLFCVLLILALSIPADAAEILAPEVPKSGFDRMPRNTELFGTALLELIQNSEELLWPEWKDALHLCSEILILTMVFSLLPILSKKIQAIATTAGTVAIATVIFQHTDTMIGCASEAVFEICEYGKLLCPVLTTALAAQGGISASAALYTGTLAFITLLSTLISRMFIPMLNVFLVFSVSHCALGGEIMRKIADAVKNLLQWLLKTVLIVFATYMSLTGVISGTTDAAALKAAKVTISSVVPVVGGILSDVSESVLVGIGVMKNGAGIYGILAVLAVFVGPFLKVGMQYLLLKGSAAICSIWAGKRISALVDDFAKAMGLLIAMVATSCVLVLISTVCFLKGIG